MLFTRGKFMVETIAVQKINLDDLISQFGLERIDDLQFFPEWQDGLPELTDSERQALDEVKADYLHLSRYTILKPIVKLVVLSPLLKLVGFYRPPFYLTAEKEVEIVSEDEELIIKGRLDLLVFTPEFWILVIEAKGAKYSLDAGIPQVLKYMLGHPNPD
jgi:hypothetical protein